MHKGNFAYLGLSSMVDMSQGLSYNSKMINIIQSDVFKHWLENLKDRNARVRIQARIDRMEDGNFGDVKPVGGAISEARIHDKSTQNRDIKKAI